MQLMSNVSRHMKRLLVSVLIALPALSASPAEVKEWATAISRQSGTDRAIVFRYAKAFRKGFQQSMLPERVVIVWRYKSDSGMPVLHERESMDRMEDLLASLVEKPGVSVLALVSTGENLREWTFYTKSEGEFFVELNKALAGQPKFPIEIRAAQDPEWSTFERFRKGVRE